jgi:dTDP-4-dehydrorhamnose reductase
MNKKPSIFLTGGSGLLALNWFFSKRNEFSVNLGLNERKIYPDGAHLLNLDFRSEYDVSSCLKALKPTYVIHTAGLTSVEKCEANPELAFQINVELAALIARVTKALSIPLVHISTDHLFNGCDAMYTEEHLPNAVNVYGQTKVLAENAVIQINPNALVIRTNFYGWGTSYRQSFSDQIIDSLRHNKEINLFCDVYYTPILAENLINIVHDLIDKKTCGIYHVVSDDRISKYDFGVLIAEQFGLNKSLINKTTLKSQLNLVKRPADMSLSNKKVTDLLGLNLGTVKQHVEQLCRQEIEARTKEIKLL